MEGGEGARGKTGRTEGNGGRGHAENQRRKEERRNEGEVCTYSECPVFVMFALTIQTASC